jgi:hypothetical protein
MKSSPTSPKRSSTCKPSGPAAEKGNGR